jgi:hypothetical protein
MLAEGGSAVDAGPSRRDHTDGGLASVDGIGSAAFAIVRDGRQLHGLNEAHPAANGGAMIASTSRPTDPRRDRQAAGR